MSTNAAAVSRPSALERVGEGIAGNVQKWLPDPNGTYLTFLGWPYLCILALAFARSVVSSG